RQCFFHNDARNFISIGGGVVGCRGFHSSFTATQSGLSLNMDVSTTMIVRPGKVVDFLLENQNVRTLKGIDWIKAKRVLKSLRIKTFPSNLEHKIIGLSEKVCGEQKFEMKRKNGNSFETIEMTVYDYYASHHQINVNDSHQVNKTKEFLLSKFDMNDLGKAEVAFFYEDGNPVEPKGVGRKALDMAYKTYDSEMGGKGFAYDGGKTMFTVGPLPMKKSEFSVIIENLSSNRTVRGSLDGGHTKRSRRPPQGKQYTVKINYATKIPIQSIFKALQGQDSEQFNEAY
nr:protein argonaute 4A-like [Tanacetum cinerariifolium]